MNQYASHLRVLGEKVVVVTIHEEHVPVLEEADRVEVVPLDAAAGVYRVVGHVGFMETPDVPALLAIAVKHHGLPIALDRVSYVVPRETLLATNAGKMGRVTESIYSFMLRNSPSASDYFCLPPEQVIELGTRVDL
jgi:KUP system potassium uptake protein